VVRRTFDRSVVTDCTFRVLKLGSILDTIAGITLVSFGSFLVAHRTIPTHLSVGQKSIAILAF